MSSDPLDYRLAPLKWPPHRPRTKPGMRSPFKGDWDSTMRKLEYELARLGAHACVIEVDVDAQSIRQDGRLRGEAEVRSPAVVVRFHAKGIGDMAMPADALPSWRANVRAVAYHLEHLRLAALYGVGGGEQYRGWKALPDQSQLTPAMSVEQAAEFIAGANGWDASFVLRSDREYRDGYRRAAGIFHPDRGGDPAKWNQLQEAKRVLDAHHEQTSPVSG